MVLKLVRANSQIFVSIMSSALWRRFGQFDALIPLFFSPNFVPHDLRDNILCIREIDNHSHERRGMKRTAHKYLNSRIIRVRQINSTRKISDVNYSTVKKYL